MTDIALDIQRPEPRKVVRIYGEEYQLTRRDDLDMAVLNQIAREWGDLGEAIEKKAAGGRDNLTAFTPAELEEMTRALRWICAKVLPDAPAELFDGTSLDTLGDQACLQIAQLFFGQPSMIPRPQNRAERRRAEASPQA